MKLDVFQQHLKTRRIFIIKQLYWINFLTDWLLTLFEVGYFIATKNFKNKIFNLFIAVESKYNKRLFNQLH